MTVWEVIITGLLVMGIPLVVSLWAPGDGAHDRLIELGPDGDEEDRDGEDED
jgi:hypothetical protein